MYGFIVYDSYNGQIVRTLIRSVDALPEVNATQKASYVSFYNPEICGCYLHNGEFYEDQEFTKHIEDPTSYAKPPKEEGLEKILEGDPRWIDPQTVEKKTEQTLINEILKEVKTDE